MFKLLISAATAAVFTLSLAAPTFADPVQGGIGSIVKRVSLGIVEHDARITTDGLEDGPDIQPEIQFVSPIKSKYQLLRARPTLGAYINTADETSFYYAGMTLEHAFDAGPFIAGSFGIGVRTGDGRRSKALGCETLFRESLEVGIRHKQHSLAFQVAHISHGGFKVLCNLGRNGGMDFISLRYGFDF